MRLANATKFGQDIRSTLGRTWGTRLVPLFRLLRLIRLLSASLGSVLAFLFCRRARRAVLGVAMLRRAYEHVLVAAVIEGAKPIRSPFYEGYVDALNVLGARAELIARVL